MTAAAWELIIEQGVTFTDTLTFWQDEAHTVPFDISDYDFTGSARPAATAYEKWVDFDYTKTNSNTLVMSVIIPFDAEYVTGKRFDTYTVGVWDTIMSKSGEVVRVFNGTLKISPGVTHSV